MTLHNEFRPTEWAEVVGQGHVVEALREIIETRAATTFLLSGPSGTGKTTLARLCAKSLGAEDVREIDAATHTGVEAMRQLAEASSYKSFTGKGIAFIIDECHRLSRAGWDALLKVTEEPSSEVYWFFCTTEPNKVPKTIVTRCSAWELRPVRGQGLHKIIDRVVEAKGWDVPDEILDLVVSEAGGSPRQALQNLTKCQMLKTEDEARAVLATATGAPEAIDLARLISSQAFKLDAALNLLNGMKDTNAESLRMVIWAYATTMALGGDVWGARILSTFEQPCIDQNRIGDITLRLYRLSQVRK